MKIVFTEDDGMVHERARYMRGGLIADYHSVKVLKKYDSHVEADIWFHGLSHLDDVPFTPWVIDGLEKFKGAIVFFQNDDHNGFAVDKIPKPLLDKSKMFLRNVWPSDITCIDSRIVNRTGLFNPLLKPNIAKAGKQLSERKHQVSFIGAATGDTTFDRVFALNLLKNGGIPFWGGLIHSDLVNVDIPTSLRCDQVSLKEYFGTMEETAISLVLYGYNPLTFRLFESFSRRCLVMAQSLDCIRFADCGMKDGVHYVKVLKDLSDLVEKIKYYTGHSDEAQQIADNGYKLFKEYLRFSGVNLPFLLYKEIVGTWMNIGLRSGSFSPLKLALKAALPLIKSL